ncbi:MAG: hypothetical protein JWL77_3628, partial [Chthonomonadaceae bacterium]|nr:hypothetical protein [Chthonomonadaceae bacterium]
CVVLDSDAYPRLSWSSALLTDEGFYLHNARNRVLFGHAQTDQFNNGLIMPLLDGLQTGVFRLLGVSAVSARAISVVLGLLTLPVFFDALRRAFGLRTALLGLLLLGLDHVSLLYARMALMDTPAAFVLVCAFWLWVRSGEGEGRRWGRLWLGLCGFVLGVCYGVRGLGALVYPVPLLLLVREGWQTRQARCAGPSGATSVSVGPGRAWFPNLLCLLGGLMVALAIYGMVWYLPNRAELTRVNHYYLFDQLVPRSVTVLLSNWRTGLFGDHRGLMPFLFRHQPVQTCLVLIWLVRRVTTAMSSKDKVRSGHGNASNADFLTLWLLVFWGLLCSIDYAPSRYYVLFLPAFSALAGLTLSDVFVITTTVQDRTMALICALFGFHLAQSALHHLGIPGIVLPGGFGIACLVIAWLVLSRSRTGWIRAGLSGKSTQADAVMKTISVAALMVWSVVNLYWTGDWLLHLTYRQRDADRWLAANLPANSVLIGAVTPGLSMNNRFVCVNVIEKLCNDHQPLETYAPAPRYVLILDDGWREVWWQRHYPAVIARDRRIHAFHGLLRPFFVIGVYKVPDEMRLDP